MITQQFAYPLDTSGNATSNLVTGERHTITPAGGNDFLFFVPRSGPYFLESISVVHVQSGNTLQMGVDWAPGWKFESATDSPPYLNVYGAVVVLNSTYQGAVLEVRYQTLGGQFTLDDTTLTTILANVAIDPRITSWENVTEVPGQFIADPHLHHITATMGYDELVQAIRDFATAYIANMTNAGATLAQHLSANNPHGITASTIGLDHLVNVTKAALADYTAATPNDLKYITPALLKQILGDLGNDLVVSSPDQVFETVVGTNGVDSWTSTTTNYYEQASAVAAVTYRGKTVKTALGYQVHAVTGTEASLTLHSAAGNSLGGVRASGNLVGMINASGNWLGYFNADGVFQHNGMNRLSDMRIKNQLTEVDIDYVDADSIGFYKWIWATDDSRVSDYLQGKEDFGVLAQEVLKVWPDAVSHDKDADVYRVDDGKVALRLALIALKRTAPRPTFVQWLLNLIKGK